MDHDWSYGELVATPSNC